MRFLASVALFALAANLSAAETMAVHGRLTYANGNPSARIWIVGTKRILGIRDIDEAPALSKELRDLLTWDREIYADFVVEPLTPFKPGVMQMVRVVSASRIVVVEKPR